MSYAYLRESYNTGKDYLKTSNPRGEPVLKREPSEQYQEYSDRLDRAPVRNHIGLIVDRYHSAATKTDAEREDNWNEWWGEYKEIFWDGLKEAQIVGASYIVSSLNSVERLSEIDLQCYIVPQDCVVKYLEGRLFAFEEWEDDIKYTIIYTWDGGWQKIDQNGNTVESGDSGFGELPVVQIKPQFAGVSQVGMLAPIQESLVNLLSLHMEETLQQTFTRHLISGLSDIPQTYEAEQAVQRMMSGKKLLLFKDQVSVSSLAADASQGQNILAAIEQTENMLYAVAGLRLSEPVRESGLAKQIEMEQFKDVRNKLVGALQSAENAFLGLLSRAFGVEWAQTSYSYDVINKTWSERIGELKELQTLGLSEEFYQTIRQRFENDYLLDGE